MNDLIVIGAAVAWGVSGGIGGEMLNYPGDGITFRNFAGPLLGPIALLIALMERAR